MDLKHIASTLAVLGSGALILSGCEKEPTNVPDASAVAADAGEASCKGDDGEASCKGDDAEGSCKGDDAEGSCKGDDAEGSCKGDAAEGSCKGEEKAEEPAAE